MLAPVDGAGVADHVRVHHLLPEVGRVLETPLIGTEVAGTHVQVGGAGLGGVLGGGARRRARRAHRRARRARLRALL